MKYFIVAGEASGDLHGANLMKSLKEVDHAAAFYFFGGELMLAQGGVLLKHYRDMAFMGAIDVLMHLGKIKKNFQLCKEKLLVQKPDLLILIDYPGFNLKIAEFAHLHKIPVFYYILPKVWAWKAWRVKKLKSYADALFSIFPFESDFFRRYGVEIHYHGNPLMDSLNEAKRRFGSKEEFLFKNKLTGKPVVAFPRKYE
jgi:lipid-A-disaccharide synthase